MRRIITGLALISALALAACSSSGGSSGGATTNPGTTPAPAASSTSGAGGSAGAGGQPSASGTQVTITGFAFAPATVTVKVGSTVTWTNDDSASHTVTADDGSFDSGGFAKGATFSHTFTKPGTYPYHCTFHGSMQGTVTVTQ
jgi:plastocyanin